MELYFIRHGQSENNALYGAEDYDMGNRRSDPKLTELGHRQAQLAADFLKRGAKSALIQRKGFQNRTEYGLTHIYCSLMERAVQTGSIIAQTLDVPLFGVPDLHEVGGVYYDEIIDGVSSIRIEHGLTPAYLLENYPRLNLLEPIPAEGWWKGGREERAARVPRALRMLDLLFDRHGNTEDRVGVITHGGFFFCFFRGIFGLDLDETNQHLLPYQVELNNCAITRFSIQEARYLLVYHNRTDFLPDDMVT
ncbi:MAG: histidine phosphatase family protein [Chloroflexi bacterium]|nr:histidine phosphatase family protein [Chloroflexota bacterium]